MSKITKKRAAKKAKAKRSKKSAASASPKNGKKSAPSRKLISIAAVASSQTTMFNKALTALAGRRASKKRQNAVFSAN